MGQNRIRIEGQDAWIVLTDSSGRPVAETVVDTRDLHLVVEHRWSLGCGTHGAPDKGRREFNYVHTKMLDTEVTVDLMVRPRKERTRNGQRTITMHRLIAGSPPPGMVTDHIDRNRLNNRRSNLRHVTYEVNNRNRGAPGAHHVDRIGQGRLFAVMPEAT
jgi:hypothetical protein